MKTKKTPHQSPGPSPRNTIDVILDLVRAREREVTLDTDGFTEDHVEKVISMAKARGLSAAYDGRFVLIRDLR